MLCAQIVDEVPTNLLPTLFAQLRQQKCSHKAELSGGRNRTQTVSPLNPLPREKCPAPDAHKVRRLLQLLNASFHTPILLGCYEDTSSEDSGACAVSIPEISFPKQPTSSLHNATQPSAKPKPARTASTAVSKAPYPIPASTTFMLLAGAARLAGGNLAAAWDCEGLDRLKSSNPDAPRGQPAAAANASSGKKGQQNGRKSRRANGKSEDAPPAKLLRAHGDDAASKAFAPAPTAFGPSLTQVSIALHEQPPSHETGVRSIVEHPRWCVALAQLRTVRTLSLSAHTPAGFSPWELAPALRSLSALRNLSLRCREDAFNDIGDAGEYHGPCAERATVDSARDLMRAVYALTQISALELHHCFAVGTIPMHGEAQGAAVCGMSQLSRLSQLTSLVLIGGGQEERSTAEVVNGVAGLSHLRHLHATLRTQGEEHVPEFCGPKDAGYTAWELCCLTELTALQSISQAQQCRQRPGEQMSRVSRDWFNDWPDRLVVRLTQLDLSGNDRVIGQVPDRLERLMALLSKGTALRSLDISDNRLNNGAMLMLAPMLSNLSGLTCLNISSNDATHDGIFLVLKALIKLRAAGVRNLKNLDISDNCINKKKIEELKRLVGKLKRVSVTHWQSDRLCTVERACQFTCGLCCPPLRRPGASGLVCCVSVILTSPERSIYYALFLYMHCSSISSRCGQQMSVPHQ